MPKQYTARDKQVSREVHKLFWRTMSKDPLYFAATILGHPPFYFLVNIMVPLETAYGLQAIITNHFSAVGHHVLLVLIYSLLGCLMYLVASWGINRMGAKGATRIQREVFANYLQKDYEFYGTSYIGALGSQAVNLREAYDDYNLIFLMEIPKVVVIVVFSLLIIALHSPLLALMTLLAMTITLSLSIFVSIYRLRYRRIVSESSSQLAGVLGDALSHAAAVKTFNQQDAEQQRLTPALARWQSAQLRSWDLAIPANSMRYMLLAVTTAVLLVISSHLYQQHKISIAIITLVQLYVIRLLTVTLEIGEIIKNYERIMGAAYAPVATMLVPAEVKDPDQPKMIDSTGGVTISFSNVTYTYPEAAVSSKAVNKFSLQVKPGEKIGLVGRSGGGKSTITKLLLRFMDVGSGGISLNGVDIREAKQSDVRRLMAYVPQEPVLFHRTIEDNIIYANPLASKQQMLAAAKTAYVDDFVDDFPKGYHTMVGERGIKLSGGQRQRVAIARALLADAPILVLDEATSALDSESEKYIQSALWELMKNRTAIVVAHRLSTIQRMDRIAVVDKGKIVQLGSHEELLKDKDGMYAALWAHQSDGYLAES